MRLRKSVCISGESTRCHILMPWPSGSIRLCSCLLPLDLTKGHWEIILVTCLQVCPSSNKVQSNLVHFLSGFSDPSGHFSEPDEPSPDSQFSFWEHSFIHSSHFDLIGHNICWGWPLSVRQSGLNTKVCSLGILLRMKASVFEKTEGNVVCPRPGSKEEQWFICLTHYYCTFIPNFSQW